MKAQTAQLNQVLKRSIKALGLSLREVEKRLGMSRGYLTRLFSGEMDLKVDHIVDIAEILGVEPEEIFRLAFPSSRAEPGFAVQRLRETFGVSAEPDEAVEAGPSAIEREIEQIVNRALGKAFSKLNP
ncbi:MAG TPA: helix-turn-helix transcriptional regulator [Thermoanaerobaculia bacterium]|jgi:transcriptional regulator with XRE-family HTH domain|nr:helix-turn-helix transcriptional regulator [Thermoanaerobaculia bacterium]